MTSSRQQRKHHSNRSHKIKRDKKKMGKHASLDNYQNAKSMKDRPSHIPNSISIFLSHPTVSIFPGISGRSSPIVSMYDIVRWSVSQPAIDLRISGCVLSAASPGIITEEGNQTHHQPSSSCPFTPCPLPSVHQKMMTVTKVQRLLPPRQPRQPKQKDQKQNIPAKSR